MNQPRLICGCLACAQADAQAHPPSDTLDPRLTRMFLCGTCGNKRCPHASDHRNPCTGSNEPGQPGSAYDAPNPFVGLAPAVHAVFESMLADIYRTGNWDDRHEHLLERWRSARGEAAKDAWGWWFGEVDGESYDDEAPTRAEAIAAGRARFPGDDQFWIVEARFWADNVKEGDDVTEFAEMRNRETILLDPAAMSQAEAEARGLA